MPPPKISLKGRALRYLSMREHSRLELARKLSRHATEHDNIDRLLDELEAANFLSQARFSESLVNRRAARFGNSRILLELQSHGIDADALTGIKASLNQDEAARARAVWSRKFDQPPVDAVERFRQMRFLQQRGFSHRAIIAALLGSDDEDEGDHDRDNDNDNDNVNDDVGADRAAEQGSEQGDD